jgi:arylsulfatase A-like enzyme
MQNKAPLLSALAAFASATATFAHDTGAAHHAARFSAQPPVEMLEILRDGKGIPPADSDAVRALTARHLSRRSNRPADSRSTGAASQFHFVTTPFSAPDAVLGDALTLTSYTAPAGNGALMAASFAPFKPRVRFYWDATTFYEESDNMPDNTMMPNLMVGITSWQQQIPVPAAYFASTTNPENNTGSLGYGQPNYWRLPLVPVPSAAPIPISAGNFQRGAVALAANGIAIFNPKNNTGRVSYEIGELDAYGGHCGLADDYHYHIIPTHLLSAFGGVLGNDKPVAWALDGYPIYGYVEPDGTARQAPDADGGHDIGNGWGYHYHAMGTTTVDGTHPYGTPQTPYLMSNFHGTVVNFGGQVDGQPEVGSIRASGTGGYTASPVSGASIIAFKNPVALTTDGSGNLIENVGGTPSADSYLMRVSISGTSYDECWKINRNVNPKTMTVTWRLAGATTTTTYTPTAGTAAGNRLATYTMAAASQTNIPDTSQTLDTTSTFGEDADYTIHPQSFTDNGNGTVTDNVTGLMWQKTDNGESTWETAVANAVGITTGGFTDWRLPTPSELFSIFNHNNANPALNTIFFPSNGADAADYWWTSDISGSSTTNVWCSNAGGGLGPKPKAETVSAGGVLRYSARYVRGAKPTNGHNYVNNGDGTITDLDTGLMWSQLPGASTTWDAALSYAENLSLGGFSDWRLPNVKELQTLTDYTLANAVTPVVKPSMNRSMFAKTLTACTTTAGGTTITCADTTGLIAGMPLVDTADVAGTYLPTATPPTVATITNATTFTVNSGTGIVAGSGITLKALAPPTAFWASTSQNNATANAWVVEFGTSNNSTPPRNAQGIISQNVKTATYPVFAVRTTSVTTQIAVEQPSGTALTDGVSTVSYGNVNVGGTSTKTFVIRNNGITSLAISGVNMGGTNAANFTVIAASATTIAAGGSTTMDVRFNAGTAGTKVAALHIANDDPAVGGSFDITLSGTGYIPPPVISSVTAVPAVPSNTDTPAINATVTPAIGATISSVQLTYSTGAQVTSTVFNETMASVATGANGWDQTASPAVYPWTLVFQGGAGNIKQTTAANHTPAGQGGSCGLEFGKGSATNSPPNSATTANAINATGTSGYVEFHVAASNVAAGQGWSFLLAPDGSNFGTARISELTGSVHGFTKYHCDLLSTDLVSTLKMQFQFFGNNTGGAGGSKVQIDDITVVTTTVLPPQTLTMSGPANGTGGVYTTVPLPAQASGTTVSYTITATDSNGSATIGGGSYTTGPAPAISTVSLSGGTLNGAYSQTLAASGGSGSGYTWSVSAGSLPAGFTLSATGVLSGSTGTAGTYNFTAQVTDSAGRIATQALTLIIATTTAPNVVIILTDDHGWGDVGYHTYGANVPVQTPNMDKLGVDGIRLEKFYPTTVCAVTRGCLLTGRNSLRTNVGNQKGLGLTEHLMPQTFKAAGYQTCMVGKWHLGGWDNDIYTATVNGASITVNHEGDEYLPLRRGWDFHKGQYGGAIHYFTHTTADPGKNNALDWWLNGAPVPNENTDLQGNGGYSTDLLADQAVAQIQTRDKTKPMLLYLAFNGVHAGVQAPQSYITKYQNLGVAEPRRTLMAAMDCMDVAMGRVLAALESEGITNNTLVVFMSDNGGETSSGSINLPLRGAKSDSYDGGLHTPAAIRWPGHLAAGVTSNQYVWVGDIFPTVCAAVGVTPQNTKPFDGVNIWPQLQSISSGNPDGAARGVPLITGDAGAPVALDSFTDPVNGGSKIFKLIRTKAGATITNELFNMTGDPYEATDLLLGASASSYAAIVSTLTADITGIVAENYPPYIGPAGITQTVAAGGNITLYAPFTSYKAPTVQWRKNGTNISNASPFFNVTSSGAGVNGVYMATLTLGNVTDADAANYDVTVTSTSGTVTSPAGTLTVVDAPVLAALPAFSTETSRTLAWPAATGATGYTIQIATTTDFAAPLNSQSVSSPTATFGGLTSGFTYYYRATANSGGTTSAYSNVVFSTQDATTPGIAISSPAAGSTTHSSIIVQGTASDTVSGLNSVVISGVAATTGDSFAHWSATVPLNAGNNTLTVTATDRAGNFSTAPLAITRNVSTANDGVPDAWKTAHGIAVTSSSAAWLYAYAFNLDPQNGAANPVLPSLQDNPTDGLRYLTVSYPRVIGSLDLIYAMEISTDLTTWLPIGSNFQILGTAANADGLTQIITVRVLPSIGGAPQKFVRVGVTAQ